MRCHVCNVEVGEGQRFCHECGESLTGVTDATQELTVLPDADSKVDADLPPTQAIDEVPSDAGTDDTDTDTETDDAAVTAVPASDLDATDLPDTEAIPASDLPDATTANADDDAADADGDGAAEDDEAVPAGRIGASLFDPATAPPDAEPDWSEPIPPLSDDLFATSTHPTEIPDAETIEGAPAYESTTTLPVHEPGAPFDETTGRQPALFDAEASAGGPLLDGELRPFKVRPTLVLAFLGMLAALMASVADVTDIRTDRVVAGIDNRLSTLADLGSNLPLAGFIGAAVMLVGGLLHCFGLRWGAGLAGGAGLALAGWAGLVIGLAEVPINSAERITRDPNTPGPFTLTVTRDLGYWLVVALAGIGLVVFAFSLVSAGTGGRRGLDPWTAALGALAAVVIAAGPLITVEGANFDVNFGTDDLPFAFFAGRLVQLALIAGAGVVGFLLVRAYGLGLAAGGVSVTLWLWLSSLRETGDRPLGVAAGNLGSGSTEPHAVTTVGVAATLVMLVVAATIAIVQNSRSTA